MAPPPKTQIASIEDMEHVKAHFNIVHGKTPKVEIGVSLAVTFDKIDKVPELIAKALGDIKEQAKENHINLYPTSDQF